MCPDHHSCARVSYDQEGQTETITTCILTHYCDANPKQRIWGPRVCKQKEEPTGGEGNGAKEASTNGSGRRRLNEMQKA